MKLKRVYDTQADIPEAYRDLFTERGGRYEMTEVEGIAPAESVERLEGSIKAERDKTKSTERELAGFKAIGRTAEELTQDLAERDELKAKVDAGAGDKWDQEKFDQAVATRVQIEVGPKDREIDDLKGKLTTAETSVVDLSGKIQRATVTRHISDAALAAKCVGTAVEDIVAIGLGLFSVNDDGEVVTAVDGPVPAGLTVAQWIESRRDKSGHWWPSSVSAGAKGGDGPGGFGNNPWTEAHWNVTDQNKQFLADASKAKQMAEAAGVKIGSTAPLVKKIA